MSWHEIKPRMGLRSQRREGLELSIRLDGQRPVLRLSLGDDVLGRITLEDGTVLEPILAIALPGWARNGSGGGK